MGIKHLRLSGSLYGRLRSRLRRLLWLSHIWWHAISVRSKKKNRHPDGRRLFFQFCFYAEFFILTYSESREDLKASLAQQLTLMEPMEQRELQEPQSQ